MALTLGLIVGLVFGIASAFANRLWGTVLACVPIATWFVLLAIAAHDGWRDSAITPLCYALFGIVVGVFVGQIFDRQRSARRRAS